MKRPRVVVPVPARKPGRPRSVSTSDEPAAVYVTLADDDYDFAFKIARRDRISVPEVLRRAFRDWRSRQR